MTSGRYFDHFGRRYEWDFNGHRASKLMFAYRDVITLNGLARRASSSLLVHKPGYNPRPQTSLRSVMQRITTSVFNVNAAVLFSDVTFTFYSSSGVS